MIKSVTSTSIVFRFRRKFKKIKLFGVYVIIWIFFDDLKIKPFSETINIKKHKVLLNWLLKKYNGFIQSYKEQFSSAPPSGQCIPKKIWICWWDGTEAMPQIVKTCYNSVLFYASDFEVTVVTKYNFTDFISIPVHILDKLNAKKITLTHLSDIIRMSLLYHYGGLWLDSTVLLTNTINVDNISFFTVRMDYGSNNVSKNRWTGNCIGASPKNVFFLLIFDFFCNYWTEFDEMLSYHLIDYSIALAYNSFSAVKKMFDVVVENNKNYMLLRKYLNNEFDPLMYKEIIQGTNFHKFSWKEKYHTKTSGNKRTFYGYITEKYSK